MPRNTHKNRTKLINNKRTNKQIGTLKKRRINKKRGGDVDDTANLGRAGLTKVTEKVSDKEIITAVLDKYLDFLKKRIETDETKKSGEFVIKFLLDNDKKKHLINEMISDKASYEPLWEEIAPSTKETLTKIQKNPLNVNIQEILDNIFYEFKEAEDIVNEITDKLKLRIIEKKLKKTQIEQINQIIKNQPGMLSNVSKNIAAGFEHFGSWLVPQPSGPQKEYNETKVHFLWYPRMYPRYRKGNSNAEKTIKYGDFMVYIEPEKYASTLEFINQTTSGVDDLLTNILNGYQHPSAIPDTYRHTYYKLTNNQPQLDNEAALINPNVKKPSPQEKK